MLSLLIVVSVITRFVVSSDSGEVTTDSSVVVPSVLVTDVVNAVDTMSPLVDVVVIFSVTVTACRVVESVAGNVCVVILVVV